MRRLAAALRLRARRFLAAGTGARVDIWYLMHDLLRGGLEMPQALEAVMRAKARETFRVEMLRDWNRALAAGGDAFAVELSRWVPASEAMVFYGLGRARAETLFLAAARVAEMRAKQVRAVAMALFWPLVIFLGCAGMTWFMGYEVFPAMRAVSDPSRWDAFSAVLAWASEGLYAHDLEAGLLLVLAVLAGRLVVLRWTGRGRAFADRFAPFSLYRMLSGSGFLFVCVEFLRVGVDLNAATFAQFERGASAYVRSRMRRVSGLMLNEGLGFGSALAASGHEFPDKSLVAVAAAMEGRADWEETLAGFVERWIERSEAVMRAKTMVLNTVLMTLGTAQMLWIFWVSFDIATAVQNY